jgi:hypothetical protein
MMAAARLAKKFEPELHAVASVHDQPRKNALKKENPARGKRGFQRG